MYSPHFFLQQLLRQSNHSPMHSLLIAFSTRTLRSPALRGPCVHGRDGCYGTSLDGKRNDRQNTNKHLQQQQNCVKKNQEHKNSSNGTLCMNISSRRSDDQSSNQPSSAAQSRAKQSSISRHRSAEFLFGLTRMSSFSCLVFSFLSLASSCNRAVLQGADILFVVVAAISSFLTCSSETKSGKELLLISLLVCLPGGNE